MFRSTYRCIDPDAAGTNHALLISFFGGDPHYARCAERLAAQCERFGVEHDICELSDARSDWLSICRAKIDFYVDKLAEHRRAVFWIDVDSQIIGDPHAVLRSEADLSGFLRNFRYFVGFDSLQFSRLMHPGYLRIGNTNKGRAFAAKMRAVAADSPSNATDDYVLEQALREFGEPLRVDLLPPDLMVSSNEGEGRERAVFQHSDSGNVLEQKKRAEQHDAGALSTERQKRVLSHAASDALDKGERTDAIVFLRRIRRIDPDDADAFVKLLNLLAREGRDGAHRYHLEAGKKNPVLRAPALRVQAQRQMAEGHWDAAARSVEMLEEMGAARELDFLASRRMRHDLDRRAARLGLTEEDRIGLWWWEQPYPGNLGDMINPYIVEKLTGTPPFFTNASPRILAVGSIAKFARAGDHVWGAGVSSSITEITPEAHFRAVRGPLTREVVLAAGGHCPPIYGDAAWLLPRLHVPAPAGPKRRIGLIRHFTHSDVPVTLGDDAVDIPILRAGYEGIEAFLAEMAGCEAILSTSLHGVIIANAYGIPARWCTFSGSARQIHGDGLKFDDYFQSIGRRDMSPLDLSGIERIDGSLATSCTDNPEHAPDLKSLLAAAPFEVPDTAPVV